MKKYTTILTYVKILILGLGILSIQSCTKNFTEFNTNPSQLMSVGLKQLAGLFTATQMDGSNWLTTGDYSRMSSTCANHLCGFTACGNYPYEENQLSAGWEQSGFNDIYTSGLPDLQCILDVSKGGVNDAAYNVALIWKVFLMHRVTDLWGPVPYKDAGLGLPVTTYESQKDVYYEMFDDLTNAVSALTALVQNNPNLNVFGIGDMIYNGNVSEWIKFGNSLRLRLAIRISNIDPTKAQAEAEDAVKGNVMSTNADDALLQVNKWASGGNGMPRMVSFYQDVMSASMESLMKGYNDPRMSEYFLPVNPANITAAFPDSLQGNANGYNGMANGFDPSQAPYLKAYSIYGPRFADGNQLVTPINIMNAAETYFLKAESAWRGWNMGGTAQTFYEQGITTSITQWKGTTFSSTSIDNYIHSTATPIAPRDYPYYDPPLTDIPVQFSTDKTKQYEQIITQKWLALFPISFEAYAEYRRTRLPKIYAKKYSINANVLPSLGQIITRLPYPTNEKSTQPAQIANAVSLLGGPDLENTPLWWDVNKNGN